MRPSKKEVVEQIAAALSLEHVKPETREIVLSLFAEKYVELVQIRLQDGAAIRSGAANEMMFLEPSDLMLELYAALVANDSDKILSINHRIRS